MTTKKQPSSTRLNKGCPLCKSAHIRYTKSAGVYVYYRCSHIFSKQSAISVEIKTTSRDLPPALNKILKAKKEKKEA